jgi:hypothetical protein
MFALPDAWRVSDTSLDELVTALVRASCEASEVPEHVTDRAALLDVASWLRQCDD